MTCDLCLIPHPVPAGAAGLRELLRERDVQIAELRVLVQAKDTEIAGLREQMGQLGAQVADLAARVGQNSKNSGKPPSSDGLGKPEPKSLRKKTGRRASQARRCS